MPTYVYKCNDCDTKYEVFQKSISDETQTECPKCKSENNRKMVTAANFNGFSSSKSYDAPVSSCASGMCGLN